MVRRYGVSGIAIGVLVLLFAAALGNVVVPASAATTAQWIQQPDMPTPLAQAAVVQDSSGLVYFIGGVKTISGSNYGTDAANVSSYNTTTGVWHELAPLPQATRGAAVAMGRDGRIYVFGGSNRTLGTLHNTQIYNPKLNSWSVGASIPEYVWEAKAATAANGMIYVVGGENKTVWPSFSRAVFVYNPDNDSWSAGPSMPVGTKAGAFVVSGNAMYYIGGITSSGVTSNVEELYTWGTSGYWYNERSLPRPTAALAAVLAADGFIYAFGGGPSELNVNPGYDATYVYNPFENIWTTGPDLLINATYSAGAATRDGQVFCFGGNNNTKDLSTAESLRVMTITAALSSSTVGQGRFVELSVSCEFAFAVPNSAHVNAYVISAGTTYAAQGAYSEMPGSWAYDLVIPQTASPGPTLIQVNVFVYYASGSAPAYRTSLPITILAAPTPDQQIASLEQNLTALQNELNSARAKLDALNSTQSQSISALQNKLSLLQNELDSVKSSSSGSSTFGMVNMALLVVIVVLAGLALMMSRRKA